MLGEEIFSDHRLERWRSDEGAYGFRIGLGRLDRESRRGSQTLVSGRRGGGGEGAKAEPCCILGLGFVDRGCGRALDLDCREGRISRELTAVAS
jgi:hypothetical protein